MAKMTTGGGRVKRAHLKVRKRNKYGKPYVGQNELVVSHGMFSRKEAHRELSKAADDAAAEGQEVVDAVIEGYDSRENPEISSNPRHRGSRRTLLSERGKQQELLRAERDRDASKEANRRPSPPPSARHTRTFGGFQRAPAWLQESPALRREQGASAS